MEFKLAAPTLLDFTQADLIVDSLRTMHY